MSYCLIGDAGNQPLCYYFIWLPKRLNINTFSKCKMSWFESFDIGLDDMDLSGWFKAKILSE